jgi:hypothetical protein
MAHTYNPSYSGGRDQEDSSLKSDWANSSQDPILKKPITKKGLVEWLKMKALSSNPSTTQKKSISSSQVPGQNVVSLAISKLNAAPKEHLF